MPTKVGELIPVRISTGNAGSVYPQEYLVRRIWKGKSDFLAPPPDCQFLDGGDRGADLWVRESESEILLWHPRFQLFLDLSKNGAEVHLVDAADWQNVLRMLYFFAFLSSRGLLLHASGVVRGGFGYIFPGPSGAGKTTIVRQSTGMAVLSDDLLGIDLSPDNGSIFALGTPFHGDWGKPGEAVRVPVKGLYFPVHGQENILMPLGYEAVVKRVLSCVTTFTTWPARLEKLVDLAMDLAQRVQGYSLSFRPEPAFWDVIDAS